MPLQAGIVGLPNVGKSTLFNAITNAGAEAANYPFCTIEPNVGIVEVPDSRLAVLTGIFKPKQTVPTTFQFVDIAGLVRGASKGEGLGNQFLSHIREVDAIIGVVRCFDDDDVVHVHGEIDPVSDIDTINLELIFADLATLEKRIDRTSRAAKAHKDAAKEYEFLSRLKAHLESGKLANRVAAENEDEAAVLKELCLLTAKPFLFVCNVGEGDVARAEELDRVKAVAAHAASLGAEHVSISAKVESEIAELSEEEKRDFLVELGLTESGLDRLTHAAYRLLGLETFFTGGEKEVRAWTYHRGWKAPACAGVIHSDFEKTYIRAEVVGYDDLIAAGSWNAARDAGKLRVEGKEYVMKDGDVCFFRVGA
ncbi:MAG: redox-regulated ATPase YchF [Candidatus Sumerlaeia bacterium]|nr:redox-regulated ATPase YchF [Candidatus Sumerlaeia bacterium]